jgi:hypothetical protein
MNNSITSNSIIINNSITTTSINSTSRINNYATSTSLTDNSYLEIPILTRQNGCEDLLKLLNNGEANNNISRQYSTDSNDSNDSDYDKSNFDNFKVSSLFILPPSIIDTDENIGTVIKSPAESNKFTNDELNYINEMQIDQYSAFLN